ncbi:Mov34/MPN/PAD-1 family protein [Mesonia mobilis]|uniref:MPN domain-containing protein n=1 Tax=Mesonia mobilis TaxID=369791 RepID=A0ABQ3BSY7_9FLAO|nr:Mov34/MPN/PAD-1 family protein [Mesonia mobilis]MBQ0738542.1 Mov34/MPN/PAD-1 family protein [Aquimarina celericrescens]GGZ56505.1 hypothetical protein GCM10008088_17600 [Mesonia mobilis]
MSTEKIIKHYNNYKLVISIDVLNKISNLARKKYPKEFGGFLLGNYSNDFNELFLEKAIEPKVYKSSSMSFERDIDGLDKYFKEVYNKQGIYYVGEWHTHPDGSIKYSSTDLKTMKNIVDCKSVKILNPILSIISLSEKEIDFGFYIYKKGKLYKYE